MPDILIPSGPSPQLIFLLDNRVLQPYRSPTTLNLLRELIAEDYEAFAIAVGAIVQLLYIIKLYFARESSEKF